MANTEASTRPEYVEFGLKATSPGPFRCSEGRMRALVLEGDKGRLDVLIKRTLTDPAGGAAEYRAVGRRVVLVVGENHVRSLTKPWDRWGWVREAVAAFFVPVWAGRRRDGRFEAERLCVTAPHILVNNPISYLAGREIFGYAKVLGEFEPPEDFLNRKLVIRGYGGNFDSQAEAGWVPVLEVAPPMPEADRGAEMAQPDQLGPALIGELLVGAELPHTDADIETDLPNGIRVAARLISELREGQVRQVFLKQFRAAEFRPAEESQGASYRAVIEAPARVQHVAARLSGSGWEVKVHSVDSHPIADELGVESQRVGWSAELREFEFVVGDGEVIGP